MTHPGQTLAEAALPRAGTTLRSWLAVRTPIAARATIMKEQQAVVTPTCKPHLLCSTDVSGHAWRQGSMVEKVAFPAKCMLGYAVCYTVGMCMRCMVKRLQLHLLGWLDRAQGSSSGRGPYHARQHRLNHMSGSTPAPPNYAHFNGQSQYPHGPGGQQHMQAGHHPGLLSQVKLISKCVQLIAKRAWWKQSLANIAQMSHSLTHLRASLS